MGSNLELLLEWTSTFNSPKAAKTVATASIDVVLGLCHEGLAFSAMDGKYARTFAEAVSCKIVLARNGATE